MVKTLILLMIAMIFFVVSCGGINTGKDIGDTGNTQADVDNDTGDTGDNFPNEHDGLNWSNASYNRTWDEAVEYCKNLGGRLPTISELRTLIQNCPATETGGECGVTDSCLSYTDCRTDPCIGCEEDMSGKYSVFGDTELLWLSLERSDNTNNVWRVYFDYGLVDDSGKNAYTRVRCVE